MSTDCYSGNRGETKERGKKTFHNNIPNQRITEKTVANRLVECNGLTVITFGLFPEIAKKSEFTLVSTVSGMIRFIYKVGREASMFLECDIQNYRLPQGTELR